MLLQFLSGTFEEFRDLDDLERVRLEHLLKILLKQLYFVAFNLGFVKLRGAKILPFFFNMIERKAKKR